MTKKLFLSVALSSSLAMGQSLSLDEFRSSVHTQDPGWKSAYSAVEGSKLLINEADSMTALQFTSQLSYMNDNRQTTNPAFMGSRTENSSYYLGFSQQTNYGVQWDLLQNFTHTKVYDVSTLYVPYPDYYLAYPKADLSISLWRNFMGAETSAQTYQTQQQAIVRKKQAELQLLQKDIEIESAFFQVHSLQQALEAQQDGLSRAEKVLEWTKSRIDRELVDKSEIYQAQAAVTARKLEFIATKSNLAKAVEKLNYLRGVESSELKETLNAPAINLSALNIRKTDRKVRKDIRLQQYVNSSNEANYKASRERYKPRLDLSVSALQQALDVSQNNAISNMFPYGKDYFQVALTLTVPIDQGRESNHRAGYAELAKSQTMANNSRIIDEKLAWENNVDLAQQLQEQITAVSDLEKQQKGKADAEREKFNRGRSTLFQVLSYEQDYLAAREQKINIELQVREFLNQLNMYE